MIILYEICILLLLCYNHNHISINKSPESAFRRLACRWTGAHCGNRF